LHAAGRTKFAAPMADYSLGEKGREKKR
jgi:hypothetical protein